MAKTKKKNSNPRNFILSLGLHGIFKQTYTYVCIVYKAFMLQKLYVLYCCIHTYIIMFYIIYIQKNYNDNKIAQCADNSGNNPFFSFICLLIFNKNYNANNNSNYNIIIVYDINTNIGFLLPAAFIAATSLD